MCAYRYQGEGERALRKTSAKPRRGSKRYVCCMVVAFLVFFTRRLLKFDNHLHSWVMLCPPRLQRRRIQCLNQLLRNQYNQASMSVTPGLASFPGSPEREITTRGEPGIFSHVIKIGPEFYNSFCCILQYLRMEFRAGTPSCE